MDSKWIVCVDCESKFEFTEGEQEFYRERSFQEPKRCKKCRVVRRQRRNSEGEVE